MFTRVRTSAVPWLGLAASVAIVPAACARANTDDPVPAIAEGGTTTGSSGPVTATGGEPDGEQPAPPTTSTPTTSSPPVNAPDHPDDSAPDDSATPTTNPGDEPQLAPVASITDLIARQESLVGRAVALRATAFFLEECPPPDSEAGGPCSLLLFIADAERNGLLYGERELAVPGTVDGVRVSCEVGPETRTACAGWEHGATYEIVGVVRPQEFGHGVELDINHRTLT